MPKTAVTATRKTGKPGETKDILFMLGGPALIVGIVAREKYLCFGGLCLVATAAVPDFIRYVKISSM